MIRTPCRYETAKTESLTFIHSFVFRVVQGTDLIVRAQPIQRLSICTSECLLEECLHKMSGLGHNDILVRLRVRAFYSYVH